MKLRSGIVLLALVWIVGCSSQSIPSTSTPPHNIQPMGTTPNGGGTTDGGGGGTQTPSPAPTTMGTVTVIGVQEANGCDARYYECDGTLFFQCDAYCGKIPPYTNIATFPAALRDTCWGSPGQIGNNLPLGTTSNATEIVNILALFASSGTVGRQAAGWPYENRSGQYFFEMNPEYTGTFLQTVAAAVPGFGAIVTAAEQNSQGVSDPPTASQASGIEQGVTGKNGRVQQCFSAPLG